MSTFERCPTCVSRRRVALEPARRVTGSALGGDLGGDVVNADLPFRDFVDAPPARGDASERGGGHGACTPCGPHRRPRRRVAFDPARRVTGSAQPPNGRRFWPWLGQILALVSRVRFWPWLQGKSVPCLGQILALA